MIPNLSLSLICVMFLRFKTRLTKSGNSCLAGPVGNMEEMSSAEGLSVLLIAQEDHRRISEGDDICATINL